MTTEGPKILLIEDEQEIRRFLRVSLVGQGYRLVESATGRDGVMQAASQQPDLMILDLGLPDIDGMEVIRQVREWSQMPIIILSARGQEHQKVDALDAGADDYLTKPFSVGELVARIRVALRHVAQDVGRSRRTGLRARATCGSILPGGRFSSATRKSISRPSNTAC